MPKVFISYRRQDSADVTGRLHDRLDLEFGRDSVFMDIDTIPPGVDFRMRLSEGVQQCDVLLAVIGDRWLDVSFEGGPKTGKRRLEDPDDYVRIEVESALALGIPVVPVLVGRAAMPAEADLPRVLKELAYKNAAEVRSGPTFHDNVDRLIRGLQTLLTNKQELWQSFQKARDVAEAEPEVSLNRARKVLERVVREVYERRIGEPAGPRSLEKLVERLKKDGYLTDRFGTGTLLNKDVGFVNPTKTITAAEVQDSLTQLAEILKWYTEVEQPDEIGQVIAPRRQPDSRIKSAEQSPAPRIAIVPKGLRSFDEHDADFFLELLPGARDKEGLPESIRFWKQRVEATDELTFTVGVIYGPSGCGKSSLMKAGLIPRLSKTVISIYIEATSDDTETRLVKALRKRCPELPDDVDLTGTITALRQGRGLAQNQKVLIVVDQFEQWLHAKRQEENTELVKALRQCDGEHVQCIVMVRDDFWVALSRFMENLQIDLAQGQNVALVDLFDLRHAKKVLTAFGRAFEALPDNLPKCQDSFVDQAVAGLAEDGRVISVRLALFAEMVKSKPWTLTTLKEIGGMRGVGVTFLEETFSAASANPKHRLHQKAAQAVLKALLPEQGTDIKGNMRCRQELMEASGYGDRPTDFEAVIRILDSEVRLITPTEPEGVDPDTSNTTVGTDQKYYQLTHDYLVHSLRDWLTRKQKETRRGRAELRLADRAALWNAKPENRLLPSLWEYLNIWLLTDRKKWTAPRRKMMDKAGRAHGTRCSIVAAVLVVVTLSGVAVSRQVEEKRQAEYAAALVKRLVAADIAEVPGIVQELSAYRRWADPLLRQEDAQATRGSNKKLYVAFGLLPVDEGKIAELEDQIPHVSASQFPVVRAALLPYKARVVEPLWGVALDPKRKEQERFQAACALATYAPDDKRWNQINIFVANRLVTLETSALVAWREALRPAKKQLIKPLASIYRDTEREKQPRTYATETLAAYAADQPDELFSLLAAAELFEFPVLFDKLAGYKDKAIPLAQAELARIPPEKATEEQKELLAKRQANAAVALLRLGTPERVWPVLKQSPDSRARSYIIHSFSPLGGEPQTIVQRFDVEPDVTVRRALVLTLGQFTDAQLPSAGRQPLIDKLLAMYETEPDAGLHGAVEWLLRKWGQSKRVEAVVEKLKSDERQLQARKSTDKREWYVNTQKQTFVIVDATGQRGEFLMGSTAESDPERSADEVQHRWHIGRRFAIATHEVTKSQFDDLRRQHPNDIVDINTTTRYVKTPDSPQVGMTWYDAAAYCNFLSEREGIAKEQWCYEPNPQGKYLAGMKAKEKFWTLTGYRLPTEAEWEYACRAGTATSRYYGSSDTLLPEYAWYIANGKDRTWPVGGVKPNDLGLFDMLGNALEWCFDLYVVDRTLANNFEDTPTTRAVADADHRVLRGGAFANIPRNVRSAYRYEHSVAPVLRSVGIGLRPARTYP